MELEPYESLAVAIMLFNNRVTSVFTKAKVKKSPTNDNNNIMQR